MAPVFEKFHVERFFYPFRDRKPFHLLIKTANTKVDYEKSAAMKINRGAIARASTRRQNPFTTSRKGSRIPNLATLFSTYTSLVAKRNEHGLIPLYTHHSRHGVVMVTRHRQNSGAAKA